MFFFFFKQKTAYEMRISDWSSDVCSSDLNNCGIRIGAGAMPVVAKANRPRPTRPTGYGTRLGCPQGSYAARILHLRYIRPRQCGLKVGSGYFSHEIGRAHV